MKKFSGSVFGFFFKRTFKTAHQPIVKVEEGDLLGKVARDQRNGAYFSFQGIPYAKPPLGELRFRAPQAPEPWQGIRDATIEGNMCYHRQMTAGCTGSENCLFINVYTPELPPTNNKLKPVMVWIHGGRLLIGSGNTDFYGPDFLIPEDVVVVTFNYRLGMLGYVYFDDPSIRIPGNAGFKDQVMALKWVQRNIEKFSGDPNNVTIFGFSAGGASVDFLIQSPMAKGLFHKAIIQSTGSFVTLPYREPFARLLAEALGINTKNERKILKILQKLSVEELFKVQENMPGITKYFSADKIGTFNAVVEKQSDEPAFLSDETLNTISSGKYNQVPLMMGYTSREGLFMGILSKSAYGEIKVVQDFEKKIPQILQIPKGSELSKKVAQKIKNFYFGQEEPSLEKIDQQYLLETDSIFFSSLQATLRLYFSTSSKPIYFYRVSIDSALNIFKKIGKMNNPGVCHGDDSGYLFKNVKTPYIRPGSIEDEGIRRFTKLWSTFARNGDPNPVEKDPLITVKWKPVEKDLHHYLDIGENLTVGINPDETRAMFWKEIFSMSPAISKIIK